MRRYGRGWTSLTRNAWIVNGVRRVHCIKNDVTRRVWLRGLEEGVLKWLGHMERMSKERLTKSIWVKSRGNKKGRPTGDGRIEQKKRFWFLRAWKCRMVEGMHGTVWIGEICWQWAKPGHMKQSGKPRNGLWGLVLMHYTRQVESGCEKGHFFWYWC